MFITDIFNALCDAFTLNEMQKADAIRKIKNTPMCGDEFIGSYFCEENEPFKLQTEKDKKKD
jgi:hypothetical protein